MCPNLQLATLSLKSGASQSDPTIDRGYVCKVVQGASQNLAWVSQEHCFYVAWLCAVWVAVGIHRLSETP